jgi:hypothetical protein
MANQKFHNWGKQGVGVRVHTGSIFEDALSNRGSSTAAASLKLYETAGQK